jgi:hypothetical protein
MFKLQTYFFRSHVVLILYIKDYTFKQILSPIFSVSNLMP